MKIKLIIFDLDGVLVDSRNLHYLSLNAALSEIDLKYIITKEEHLAVYDGNSTRKKLELLSINKNLPRELYDKIWELKQKYTLELINKMKPDDRIIKILQKLKSMGYMLYCASNSIYASLKLTLLRKGFLEYIDFIISNEDVKMPKPSPEMYLQCIIRSKLSVNEILICEDSPIGRKSALDSGCHLCPIKNVSDLTLQKILDFISKSELENQIRAVFYDNILKWDGDINIVIPMAGRGSRFLKTHSDPKPLIKVNGIPMIELVVKNLNISGKYIFIVRNDFNINDLLERIAPGCIIIKTDGITEGAACSVLLAKEYINNDTPLLIANSDQYLEWSSSEFLYSAEGVDGVISTFKDIDPKWSFAKLDTNGFVERVEEKNPISDIATTGIYYWSKGSDFVKYAEKMINKNIRTNNEFYVCPVYNEAIRDGKKIKVKECKKMWGLGIPEDLDCFLKEFKLF